MAAVACGLIAGKRAAEIEIWGRRVGDRRRRFTFEYLVEQPPAPRIGGDVLPVSLGAYALVAARASRGRGSDCRGDWNAPTPIDVPFGGRDYDCLRPHQQECRALLRPRDCAAERLPGRLL